MKIEIKLELDTDRDAEEIASLIQIAERLKEKVAELDEDE
jgi:hypothetical protein